MHRGVAAVRGTDGPGTSWIFGTGGGRVVFPFAVGRSDGMNWRQIQDIESHRGDVRQAGLAILEGAVAAGDAAAGTRKQLIPRAEAGFHTIHDQLQLMIVASGAGAIRIALHELA